MLSPTSTQSKWNFCVPLFSVGASSVGAIWKAAVAILGTKFITMAITVLTTATAVTKIVTVLVAMAQLSSLVVFL